MVEEHVEQVARALRARGERMTRPRRAVLRALAALPGHPTAEEVIAEVSRRDASVHQASVYRTLRVLHELGVVAHVHLGHGGTVHHLVRPSADEHVHGQCSACGRLVDLPLPPLADLAEQLHARTGFVLDEAHVALSGTCAPCAAREE